MRDRNLMFLMTLELKGYKRMVYVSLRGEIAYFYRFKNV